MNKLKILYFLILSLALVFGGNRVSYAQDDYDLDSLIDATLAYDSILLDEIESDSSSLLALIDSLLTMDFRSSSLMLRTGYISDIVNAGRDFGVSQYGFSAGVSFYHRSGLFADVSGYWNSDISPHYNPTILSAGYMTHFGKNWSLIGSFDHYVYSNTGELSYPLNSALNLSVFYDIKFISLGLDYSFLFGDETAHRIRPNIFVPLTFNKVGFLDQITLYPSISMLMGNQNIYFLNENYQLIREGIQQNGPGWFKRRVFKNSDAIYDLIYEEEVRNVFGIMNYSFALPVNFRKNNFTFSLGYFLNFPVALPGEDIDYDPNSYFSVNLMYSIPFKSKISF